MSAEVDDEIRADFLTEAGELVQQLGRQLIELESRTDDKALLNDIFRSLHTVKRGAGFLELSELVEVCQVAGEVFKVLRAGKRSVDAELMDGVLKAVDRIQTMLGDLEAGLPLDPAPDDLLEHLRQLAQERSLPAPADVEAPPQADVEPVAAGTPVEAPMVESSTAVDEAANVDTPTDAAPTVAATAPAASAADTISEDEFEDLLDELHGKGKGPSAPEVAVAEAAATENASSDTITEDEFEHLLDELHGKGKGPSAPAAPAAPASSQAAAVNAAGSDTISEDEFEHLLDELHGKGKGPSAPAAPETAAVTAAGGDTISEDEFEHLLDELHGKGKGPSAPAASAASETVAVTAADSDTISEDEFENLLDALHGKGKGPGASSATAGTTAASAPAAPPPAAVSAPAATAAPQQYRVSASVDPEIKQDFLTEAGELVQKLGGQLIELESRPDDNALLNDIFRAFHTVKGGAGFLDVPPLVNLCHAAEDVFNALRGGKRTVDPELMDAVLQALDYVQSMMDAIAADAALESAPQELIDGLHLLAKGQSLPNPIAGAGNKTSSKTEAAPRRAPAPASSASPPPETSVRVDTVRLDKMMNLVGELVLVRNRLKSLSSRAASGENMTRAVGELDFITRGLQNAVMQIRMQPIRKVFSRFPKIARDVARGLGKEVEVELIGEDTDLDKNLVEALADPLVHMVRNSVDHGIEMPDARVRAGKPAAGKLVLSAQQQGDNIHITVRDDGGGMDAERIRAKAIEKGLLLPDEAAQMSPEECLQLVFAPGFSTKEQVSDLSGRGVGMDVVMSRIKSLGGNVRVESQLGHGSTVHIRVPLTLAILSALMVTADGREFALPLAGVLDIFELDPSKTDKLDRWDVVLTRRDTLRLVYLDPWLASTDSGGVRHVVVAQVGDERYGFVVREVRGREEIVIKPLGASLRGLAGISGATVLPDGHVALILDFTGLVETYRRTLIRPRLEVAHG